MHAFLFTGTTAEARNAHIEQRIQEWGVKPIDVVAVSPTETTIGIDEIRELKKRLLLVPYQSPYTVGVIHDMHRLTVEAQNALLKLLEEPPSHTRILGETALYNSLLPTIVSRCHIIRIGVPVYTQPTDEQTHCIELLQQIQQTSVGQRLQLTEDITKTRDAAKQWVDLVLAGTRDMLLANPTSLHTGKLVRKLIRAKQQLEANVTPKLVIDSVFL